MVPYGCNYSITLLIMCKNPPNAVTVPYVNNVLVWTELVGGRISVYCSLNQIRINSGGDSYLKMSLLTCLYIRSIFLSDEYVLLWSSIWSNNFSLFVQHPSYQDMPKLWLAVTIEEINITTWTVQTKHFVLYISRKYLVWRLRNSFVKQGDQVIKICARF